MGARDLVDRITSMRLRTRYAIALLVILAILGTIVIGTGEFFKQQAIEQEEKDLNQTANLAADQLDDTLKNYIARLRSYSSEFHPGLENSSRVLRRATAQQEPFLIGIVTNETGHIQDIRGDGVTEQVRAGQIGRDVSDRTYIAEPLDGSQYIQEPENESDGAITVTFSVPISRNSTTLGALSASILLSSPEGEREVQTFGALEPLNTSQQSTFVEYRDDEDTRVLFSEGARYTDTLSREAELEETNWVVRVERDQSTLTNRLQFLQLLQFGSLIAVLLSVFGLGFFEYRTNLKQTGRLLAGFDELAHGNFDFRPSLSGAREWEQIGEGFNSMATGIKEREQAIREREKQIRERERRLSVLNRVLRHNLQNDMTVIQGQAEIIPITDSQEQRERASEKIIEMSQGLVDHGKKARRLETVMENAQDPPAELDLVDKVGDILSSYSEEHPEFTVTTNFPDHAYVEAVSGIEFGIESLVENAFEHNDSDDPAVWVNINRGEEFTDVEIRDNGPGIPEHEIEVLRQDEETSLEHGSGIGLWLSYWAAVKSKGELEFAGEEEEGGCVTISLPTTETPESALEAETNQEADDEETSQIDDLLDIPE